MASIRVEVDSTANAAYIVLSDEEVAETLPVTDEVMIDMDSNRVAVGIEVLSLDAQIPYQRLRTEFHIHSEVVELLRVIRPSVQGFLSLTVSPDGTSDVRSGVCEPV